MTRAPAASATVEYRFAHIPQDARRGRAWVASHAPLAEVRLDRDETVPLGAFHRYRHLGEAVLGDFDAPAQTSERTTAMVARQGLDLLVLRTHASGRMRVSAGGQVMLDEAKGIVAYQEPKASIRPAVAYGTVLFRGQVHPDRPVAGTAYAYKAGCPPAPYPVRGTYADHGGTLTLRGAGPVRSGCEVVGYSDRSPHAVLRFDYLLDD